MKTVEIEVKCSLEPDGRYAGRVSDEIEIHVPMHMFDQSVEWLQSSVYAMANSLFKQLKTQHELEQEGSVDVSED